MDVILNKILDNKAKELGISKSQALEIYNSIPKFIKHVASLGNMEDENSFKSVYIKDLGTFYPNIPMIKRIQNNIKDTNENI